MGKVKAFHLWIRNHRVIEFYPQKHSRVPDSVKRHADCSQATFYSRSDSVLERNGVIKDSIGSTDKTGTPGRKYQINCGYMRGYPCH